MNLTEDIIIKCNPYTPKQQKPQILVYKGISLFIFVHIDEWFIPFTQKNLQKSFVEHLYMPHTLHAKIEYLILVTNFTVVILISNF